MRNGGSAAHGRTASINRVREIGPRIYKGVADTGENESIPDRYRRRGSLRDRNKKITEDIFFAKQASISCAFRLFINADFIFSVQLMIYF
jgi:hypothetical protein